MYKSVIEQMLERDGGSSGLPSQARLLEIYGVALSTASISTDKPLACRPVSLIRGNQLFYETGSAGQVRPEKLNNNCYEPYLIPACKHEKLSFLHSAFQDLGFGYLSLDGIIRSEVDISTSG